MKKKFRSGPNDNIYFFFFFNSSRRKHHVSHAAFDIKKNKKKQNVLIQKLELGHTSTKYNNYPDYHVRFIV